MIVNHYITLVRNAILLLMNSPSEALHLFLGEIDKSKEEALAKHKNTPLDVLAHIIGRGMMFHLSEAWNNPNWQNSSGDALVHLALSPNVFVRMGIAQHLNTPCDALVHLSKDNDANVRYEVASNRNTPLQMLLALAEDENPRILMVLRANENLPQATHNLLRRKLRL